MNPFTNPLIVGLFFILGGTIGIIRKDYPGRNSILNNIFKLSEKTTRIMGLISNILFIVLGTFIVIWQLFFK